MGQVCELWKCKVAVGLESDEPQRVTRRMWTELASDVGFGADEVLGDSMLSSWGTVR